MTPAQIEVRDLTVRYGSFLALSGVDFACRPGEFVAIVGRSGTGKSSFLNALAGLIPHSGHIRVDGRVGYVFQSHALYPWMTVGGNISFGIADRPSQERARRVREMLERIEMKDLGARYPSELSGGQVQRVALARALAPDPQILLMDEPYASLDHLTRERMQSWLLSVWQETGTTVLFVTHFLDEAVFLADRVVVLRDGIFVADFDVPFRRPRHEDLRFTEGFLDVKHTLLDHMTGRAGTPPPAESLEAGAPAG